MQVGLILLGYQLPNYGIDGLFGSETASAVQKFISDNLTSGTTVNEAVNLVGSSSGIIGRPRQGTHSASGWANNNVRIPEPAKVRINLYEKIRSCCWSLG